MLIVVSFRLAKNYRSKLFYDVSFPESSVWPVIFGLTGPICARAFKVHIPRDLSSSGHHDWPVKPVIQ